MSYTPFNAPLLSGLLGDMEIAGFFSVKADLSEMIRFEVALAKVQADLGLIPAVAAQAIKEAGEHFEPDIKSLNAGAQRDGMAVPDFIRQFRTVIGEPHARYLHFGSTSQDVIDTSLALRLVSVNEVIKKRLESVISRLDDLEDWFGENTLMARTRMQAALPIMVTHRLDQWRRPLARHLMLLPEINHQVLCLQLGGPVGTLEQMGNHKAAVRMALAEKLGLRDPGAAWHTDRTGIVDYSNWLGLVCGSLGKIGQDAVLMAQNEMTELTFEAAGESSAMAHKQNPVKAETLIALARFTATLSGGMQHAMVHEQERSGAMWTFEWLLMPQLCVATGSALKNALGFLESVTEIGNQFQ